MGKYESKKKRKSHKWIWVICLLLLVGLLTFFVMPQVLYKLSGEDDTVQGAVSAEQNGDASEDSSEEAALAFPFVPEEGGVEIENLFQFSGVNPDADNQDATDVAAIVLRNTSDQYLCEATVDAALGNGVTIRFVAAEIPSGASAMAVSVDNTCLLETDFCTDIQAAAVFEDVSGHDGISVSVEGMTVTVTNTSSEDISDIVVYYRDVFNDKYFGGVAYSNKIENLAAGDSTTFTAVESLLGVVEVVRVAVNEMN